MNKLKKPIMCTVKYILVMKMSCGASCRWILICCFLSSSGTGETHRLRAAGGISREPLLVSRDLTHSLLVLL